MAGITTISISLSEEITRKIHPPRALWPGFPLGHPLGYPHQAECQLQILRTMLKLLEQTKSPGVIIKKDMTGKGTMATTCLPRFDNGIKNNCNINP